MGVRAATAIELHTPDDEDPACVSLFYLDDKAKVCILQLSSFCMDCFGNKKATFALLISNT